MEANTSIQTMGDAVQPPNNVARRGPDTSCATRLCGLTKSGEQGRHNHPGELLHSMEIAAMRSESLPGLGNSRGEQLLRPHASRGPLSGRGSPHTLQRRSVGLMVFDHKGRFVAADARAELIMAGLGVELNCGSRLRIDAFDMGATLSAGCSLPGWLRPDWIEPVIEGNERLGTIVQIPQPWRSTTSSQGGLPGYKLRKIVEFIHAHIDQPISLRQLASLASLSDSHFHREFKRSTGLTPGKYISEVRIKRAETLLSETDLPLVQIALQVGFHDQSHFTVAFRRATSMTPRIYRNATANVRRPQAELVVAEPVELLRAAEPRHGRRERQI